MGLDDYIECLRNETGDASVGRVKPCKALNISSCTSLVLCGTQINLLDGDDLTLRALNAQLPAE